MSARPDPLAGATRVLVVEDSEPERAAVVELLEGAGFAVSEASGGRQALELLRGGLTPDAILLDLVMPELSGWEFRLEQRADPKLAGIPVVAVTGEQTPEAKAIDAAAFVQKPLEASVLLGTLRAVLRRVQADRLRDTEQMAALGRLAAAVAHEVNNPLAYAEANVRHVLDNLFPALRGGEPVEHHQVDEFEGALKDSCVGLERIGVLMKDILLFGRPMVLATSAVAVKQPLELALKIAAPRLRVLGISLEEAIDEGLTVKGDAGRLSQVFLNLVLNAADALEEMPTARRRIAVEAAHREGRAEIRFRDEGPGIDAKTVGRIFEPFFTTKPPGKGTGLGLFVCRGIVETMDGRIAVQTEVGKGTTFWVSLPAG